MDWLFGWLLAGRRKDRFSDLWL
uniref:Uncharacterized protein n=1 Tax=Arundo donax TaxID=35708 RepID=A0A0A8Z564_ARUDO